MTRDGYDPDMGARPLRRVIQQKIEDPLSDLLLAKKFVSGDLVLVTLDENNELSFRKQTENSQQEPVSEDSRQ